MENKGKEQTNNVGSFKGAEVSLNHSQGGRWKSSKMSLILLQPTCSHFRHFSYYFQLGNLPATRVGLDHLARCLIIRKGHPSWFIPSILLCFYQNSYLLYLVVYHLSTATKLQDYRRLGFIFRFLSFPSLLCSQSLKRSLSHRRQAPKK